MVLEASKRFDSALYGVSEKIALALRRLPEGFKEEVQEIRLRALKPVVLTVCGENYFVTGENKPTRQIQYGCLFAEKEDIEESFKLLIRGSVYSHLEEIKEGYIMMRYGHRAGICGSFQKNGNMAHISSINIRISKQVIGCAEEIVKHYRGGGLLIAGPPGSGKTTLLRDFIRIMSQTKRICVIDTRGEISASYLGECFNDLGENTDVLVGYKKDKGLLMALRTMFPEMVAFDEFGTLSEFEEISQGFLSGVDVALTAHIEKQSDLLKRPLTAGLLKSGAIKSVAVLNGSPCKNIVVKSAFQVIKECGS